MITIKIDLSSVLLLMLFISSCTTLTMPGDILFEKQLWGVNANKPIITVKTDDGITLRLLLDSGGENGVMFLSGLHKIDTKNNTKNDPKNQISIHCDSITCGPVNFGEIEFLYSPERNQGLPVGDIDGILGFGYLESKFSRITIDYRSNKVAFNAERIHGAAVPMRKSSYFTNLYEVDLTIDDVPTSAVLDTGNNLSTLKSNYAESTQILGREGPENLIQNDLLPVTAPKDIWISVRIGTFQKDRVRAVLGTDRRVVAAERTKKVLANLNLLGYSLFSESVVQFDFEDSVFRIK